jgi:hypothetical protein
MFSNDFLVIFTDFVDIFLGFAGFMQAWCGCVALWRALRHPGRRRNTVGGSGSGWAAAGSGSWQWQWQWLCGGGSRQLAVAVWQWQWLGGSGSGWVAVAVARGGSNGLEMGGNGGVLAELWMVWLCDSDCDSCIYVTVTVTVVAT